MVARPDARQRFARRDRYYPPFIVIDDEDDDDLPFAEATAFAD